MRVTPGAAGYAPGMNYTERNENQDKTLENDAERENESKPKHKLPFMPDGDDDTPFGSTDQHSDA